MEHAIENHDNIITTPLFWDCACADRYIQSRTETSCSRCGADVQDQPDSSVDAVLFNAKFWDLDADLVSCVWEALKTEHPLLFRAFELGFDPEQEITVVTFGDVILRLEQSLQDPYLIPAEDLAQLIIQSTRLVHVDWQGWDRFAGAVTGTLQAKAAPSVPENKKIQLREN